jgi:hypothetical protein
MRHDPEARDTWSEARPASGLPAPLDCETLALLRRFLVPILEESASWDELATRLDAKGYGLAFREGHLVILNERGTGLCTGRMLGVPLRVIARRIGRPVIRASIDGHAAALR